jgi:hypothetical protein
MTADEVQQALAQHAAAVRDQNFNPDRKRGFCKLLPIIDAGQLAAATPQAVKDWKDAYDQWEALYHTMHGDKAGLAQTIGAREPDCCQRPERGEIRI